MELREFAEFHTPALERDEARYNRILGLLARLLNSAQPNPEVPICATRLHTGVMPRSVSSQRAAVRLHSCFPSLVRRTDRT
jgi:hypothetical protein